MLLLFGLEQHHPVLRRQQIQARLVVELLQRVYILGEGLLVGLVEEQPLLLLLLLLQILLLFDVFQPDQVEDVHQQHVLDLSVHG